MRFVDKFSQFGFFISLSTFGRIHPPIDVVLLHAPECWPGWCKKGEHGGDWREAWKELGFVCVFMIVEMENRTEPENGECESDRGLKLQCGAAG